MKIQEVFQKKGQNETFQPCYSILTDPPRPWRWSEKVICPRDCLQRSPSWAANAFHSLSPGQVHTNAPTATATPARTAPSESGSNPPPARLAAVCRTSAPCSGANGGVPAPANNRIPLTPRSGSAIAQAAGGSQVLARGAVPPHKLNTKVREKRDVAFQLRTNSQS